MREIWYEYIIYIYIIMRVIRGRSFTGVTLGARGRMPREEVDEVCGVEKVEEEGEEEVEDEEDICLCFPFVS